MIVITILMYLFYILIFFVAPVVLIVYIIKGVIKLIKGEDKNTRYYEILGVEMNITHLRMETELDPYFEYEKIERFRSRMKFLRKKTKGDVEVNKELDEIQAKFDEAVKEYNYRKLHPEVEDELSDEDLDLISYSDDECQREEEEGKFEKAVMTVLNLDKTITHGMTNGLNYVFDKLTGVDKNDKKKKKKRK